MGRDRFPKTARAALVKCVGCNAPGVETADDRYVCVRCGASLLTRRPEVGE